MVVKKLVISLTKGNAVGTKTAVGLFTKPWLATSKKQSCFVADNYILIQSLRLTLHCCTKLDGFDPIN